MKRILVPVILLALAGASVGIAYAFLAAMHEKSASEEDVITGAAPSPIPWSLTPTPRPILPVSLGLVGLALKVDSTAGARPGDYVDVLAKVGDQVEVVLEDVLVLQNGDPIEVLPLTPPPPSPTARVTSGIVALAVAPEEAQRLALVEKEQHAVFYLALRPEGTGSPRPVG